MKRLMLFLVLGLVLISFASAEVNEYAPVKDGDCITIKQGCSSCSYVNVTISYPNSTLAVSNEGMDSQGAGQWTYDFCNTTALGRYDVGREGDLEGTPTSFDVLWFDVSTNGKEPADGITIVVFTIIFMLIFFFGLLGFFKALEHVVNLEMDLLDTLWLMRTYFVMWIFYYLSIKYLGNAFINDILSLAITIGAFTHLLLPLIGFAVSMIMTNLKFKRKARVTY